MKISNFPSEDEFCVRDCVIANIRCKLVFPHKVDIRWNDDNKIFRSSIWTEDGFPVSLSYKKFTNYGESPLFEPIDEEGKLEWLHKLDGSTLIFSKFRGQLIVRTRGTVDAQMTLSNGYEIEFLKNKYPKVFDNRLLNLELSSFIFEWYSPSNVIVERESNEPSLWLTGAVNHKDYSYWSQDELDETAIRMEVPRPQRYSFNTIEEMVSSVQEWKKGEGVVIYGNGGQLLKKTKALRYLELHRIKSHLSSDNNLIEYYVSNGMPTYHYFYSFIESAFDYEVAESCKDKIAAISLLGERFANLVDKISNFIHDIRGLSRKEQAMEIIRMFPEDKGLGFTILDNKEIKNDIKIDYLKKWNKINS